MSHRANEERLTSFVSFKLNTLGRTVLSSTAGSIYNSEADPTAFALATAGKRWSIFTLNGVSSCGTSAIVALGVFRIPDQRSTTILQHPFLPHGSSPLSLLLLLMSAKIDRAIRE